MPSRAILLVCALALTCTALAAALVLSAADVVPAAAPVASELGDGPSPTAATTAGAFVAEPVALPSGTLTRLEAAGSGTIEDEMDAFFAAVQTGFGDRSVELEPSLRPYLMRLVGRLGVRGDGFVVRATAPDVELAAARAASLTRIFATAGVADDQITFDAGVGPDALTLLLD